MGNKIKSTNECLICGKEIKTELNTLLDLDMLEMWCNYTNAKKWAKCMNSHADGEEKVKFKIGDIEKIRTKKDINKMVNKRLKKFIFFLLSTILIGIPLFIVLIVPWLLYLGLDWFFNKFGDLWSRR